MTEDSAQLRRFAANAADSEPAFAAFVERRIGLVYGAALRQTAGNAHLAWEITQEVFLIASQKAATLARHEHLSGWLYATTTLIALRALRDARLRRRREQEAAAMTELHNANNNTPRTADATGQMRDTLDEVLARLAAQDREIVILRYFDNLNFSEIAAHLRVNEDTARKRASRALDKMRALFARRGVTSTAAALGALLTAEAAAAAPAGLAGAVSTAILASAGTGAAIATTATTTAAATTTTGILTFMSTAKITIAVIIATLAAATIAIRETQRTRAATTALATAQTEHAALLKQITDAQRLARIQSAADAATNAPPDAKSLAALNDPVAAGEAFLAAHPEVREKLQAFNQASMAGIDYLACLDLGMDAAQRAELEKLRSGWAMAFTTQPMNGFPKMLLSTALKDDNDPERARKFDEIYGGADRAKQWREAQNLHAIAFPITAPLAQSLYYTDTPLTASQARQLETIYSQFFGANLEPLPEAGDWESLVEKTRSFLSRPQLDALNALKPHVELRSAQQQATAPNAKGKSQ